MDFSRFDARPILVAIAGSNGAGKTTFFHSHLAASGLPFVNADVLSEELGLTGYAGATIAASLRRALLGRRESFVFETVLSDPAGEKLALLRDAVQVGYTVILIYIGISDAGISEERVAMGMSQGGHSVPPEKIESRFPRTLENLRTAARELPHVLIYDNDDLSNPYRLVAILENGTPVVLVDPVPQWLRSALPSS